MSDVPCCSGCGVPFEYLRYTTKAEDYAPTLCRTCHFQRKREQSPRIVSPWMIDAQGIRCRTVEGGA